MQTFSTNADVVFFSLAHGKNTEVCPGSNMANKQRSATDYKNIKKKDPSGSFFHYSVDT